MTYATTAEIVSAVLDALDVPIPPAISDEERYLHVRSKRATHVVTALHAIRDNPSRARESLDSLREDLARCPATTRNAWRAWRMSA